MEVVVAVPSLSSMDFNFDSSCSSPFITAPSSPQRFGNFFFSAPTSPTRNRVSSSSLTEPNNNDSNEDFEFDFSVNLQRPSLSAEELFHGGKIRPLKLTDETTNKASSSSSSSSSSKRFVQQEGTCKRVEEGVLQSQQQKQGIVERASSFSIASSPLSSSSSSSCHKENGRRSLSTKATETASTFATFLSSISFSKGYRKWRIKDFLLFRSASEGRASEKDHLRKYTVLAKTTAYEDVSNSSFRSVESAGSVSRRRGPVSAHEMHYTLNRAATEELKKKTLLPYKQGLLGCLGFNHGMHHLSGRFGSLQRS